MEEINLEGAIAKVKNFFAELKGVDLKVEGNIKLIDLLDFDVLKTEETKEEFIINCGVKENLFSPKKLEYKVEVDKKTGEIKNVEKNPVHTDIE